MLTQWMMGQRCAEVQQEAAEAVAGVTFVTTLLFQTGAGCALHCNPSAFAPGLALGISRCSCRRYVDQTHPLTVVL